MELWLVYALATVVFYGLGEGLSKEPTVRLGSGRMLALYSLGSAPIYLGWFLIGYGWTSLAPWGAAFAALSGFCGTLGTVSWFRAMESGHASVVSGFTAAYPVITVAAAVLVLGASLLPLHVLAIAFLLVAAVLLGTFDHPGAHAVGRAWIPPMVLAVVMWGAWGVFEKLAIDAIGFAANAGVYVAVSTPIYLVVAWREIRRPKPWDREALPTLVLFAVAGITIILAVGMGPLAIVVPLTTAYPVVAILFRRLWMEERMSWPQKFAVGLAMAGTILVSL